MAIAGPRPYSFSIFVVATMLVFGNYMRVFGQSTCHANIPSLILECSKFVSKSGPKVRPSPGCCSEVKPIDVPCVCKHVTKDIEDMINMDKAVYVARTCGLNVPKGMKCGSKSFALSLSLSHFSLLCNEYI